jgi:type VI secretion system FHA domain protein
MPLKLRVISDHYKTLGPSRSRLFGVTGGTIGRASGNDWVLPDTKHFISSHHATVLFRAGHWLLEDTSRNGVFLNEAEAPVAKTGAAKLEDGDRLRMGEYDVLVSIDEHNDFSPDASGQMPTPPALRERSSPDSRRSRSAPHKHGTFRSEPARSKLDAFLEPDLDVTDLLVPANRTVAKKDTLANSASIQLHVGGFAPATSDNALADLCRGLAIDPDSLPKASQSALLNTVGQLLRETAVQLTRTLKQQAARNAEMEIDSDSLNEHRDNSLQSAPSIQAAIFRLLDTQHGRERSSVETLQAAFEAIRTHHDAFEAAVAPAVDELLTRLSPARLTARFDRAPAATSLLGGNKKAKYWDHYGEMFTAIDQRDSRRWPTVFARDFAKAMTAQLRERQKRDQ